MKKFLFLLLTSSFLALNIPKGFCQENLLSANEKETSSALKNASEKVNVQIQKLKDKIAEIEKTLSIHKTSSAPPVAKPIPKIIINKAPAPLPGILLYDQDEWQRLQNKISELKTSNPQLAQTIKNEMISSAADPRVAASLKIKNPAMIKQINQWKEEFQEEENKADREHEIEPQPKY